MHAPGRHRKPLRSLVRRSLPPSPHPEGNCPSQFFSHRLVCSFKTSSRWTHVVRTLCLNIMLALVLLARWFGDSSFLCVCWLDLEFCVREEGWRGHLVILFSVCDWPRASPWWHVAGPRAEEGSPRRSSEQGCTVCKGRAGCVGQEPPEGEGRTHGAGQRHLCHQRG